MTQPHSASNLGQTPAGNEEVGPQWQANVGNSNPYGALKTPQSLSSQSGYAAPQGPAGTAHQPATSAQGPSSPACGTAQSATETAKDYTQAPGTAAQKYGESPQESLGNTSGKHDVQAKEAATGAAGQVQTEVGGYAQRAQQASQETETHAQDRATSAAGGVEDYADAAKQATFDSAADAVGEIKETGSSGAGTAGRLGQDASKQAQQATDRAAEAGSQAIGNISASAQQAAARADETGSQATAFVKGQAEQASSGAAETGSQATDSAEASEEAANRTAEAGRQAQDAVKGEAQQAKQGGQGLVGWALSTASTTVGRGLELTEGAARGVTRTAGSAINTASSVANRAGQLVGLSSGKKDAEVPAQKAGYQTSTGPQASTVEDIPGEPQGLQGKMMEQAEAALQRFDPFSRIHQHVCGFHFYAHDMTRQVEAHHFCACPNEEVRQCIIYDSDRPDARLIGTEYIISAKLFEQLPEEEKVYWHSHKFEVQSGTLQALRTPMIAETLEMQKLVNTYGKTFHTWQIDRGDPLPYGPPQLMMAFTKEGQSDPAMIAKRDNHYGTDSQERKAYRAQEIDFSKPTSTAADHWEQGNGAHQLQLVKTDFKKQPDQPIPPPTNKEE